MRILILLLFLSSGCMINSGNDKPEKNVKITKIIFNINNPDEKLKYENWVEHNIIETPNDTIAKRYENPKFMYEDESFEVSGACAGEWGGVVLFTDKQNRDSVYYLSCTCPIMVDYNNDKYFITETLAHMSGFVKIVAITNPKNLPKSPKNEILDLNNIRPDSTGIIILDTGGIIANLFYPFQGKNYLIYSKYDTTYLGEIINKKLFQMEILLNYGTWSYYQVPNKIKNGIYISNINYSSTNCNFKLKVDTAEAVKGNIYFKQDTIVIGYQYSKTIKKRV